ncbi:MAG TPA: hypothetical protein VGV35_11000 [Bryobacteraceae bacterium]|nr:hypothetical protein [Bryobacteraceae bacterium]
MRILLAAAVLTLPLQAQFNGMVTTDDGSIALFQSTWRLVGSNDGGLNKIYRLDSRGFNLVFSPQDDGQAEPPSAFTPIISGDGSITGYITAPGCAGLSCNTRQLSLVLNGAKIPATLPAGVYYQLSRNGRYLSSGLTVADLTTGSSQNVAVAGSPGAFGGRFGIGNNGGVLMLLLHQAFILSTVDLLLSTHPGVVIVNASVVYAAVLSASENRVVYEIRTNSSSSVRQLFSYDVSAGQSTKLEEATFETPFGISFFQPSISNDGSRALYRRKNSSGAWEAVVRDFAAGTTTVLGPMLAGADNFVISGDGKSAWLHRSDGRLAHIASDTLQAVVAAGRHAWMEQREGGPVYGSANHLYGGGFAADDSLRPPSDLSLNYAGLACPLLKATPSQLDFQIPWEAPLNAPHSLILHSASSPFESLLPLEIPGVVPTFERLGAPDDFFRSIVTVHQDFHGLVTNADPAAPGEFLHFYMTGLGDVQPRPPTGSPPIQNGLAIASSRLTCLLGSVLPAVPLQAVTVTFAGLAPGMVGMYQMDVALPQSYPTTTATIFCFDLSSQSLTGDSGSFFISNP